MNDTIHPTPDAEALDKLIAAVEAGAAVPSLMVLDCLDCAVPFFETMKAYNGSLDAALSLHEALLPGWHWGRSPAPGNGFWVMGQATPFFWSGKKSPPSRAWLLAVLRAHRAAVSAPAKEGDV